MNIRFIYFDANGVYATCEGYTETAGATIERLLDAGCVIDKVEADR